MSQLQDNEYTFTPFVPSVIFTDSSITTSSKGEVPTKSNTKSDPGPIEVVNVDAIVLNIYLKYSYSELEAFAAELMSPNEHPRSGDTGQSVSTLHQYALESTREPIDMSNQSVRTTYRPNLFTRKNDAFGPWNFNFLLNLLEIDYQRDDANESNFPKIWKTTSMTKVRVNRVTKNAQQTSPVTNITSPEIKQTPEELQKDDITLIDLLKAICRQNKCDESDANAWLRALKGMNNFLIISYRVSSRTKKKSDMVNHLLLF
jgi:hypothetical protein